MYLKNINDDNDKNNYSLIYRVLKQREENQFIKSLNRSRATLNINKKIIFTKQKRIRFNY